MNKNILNRMKKVRKVITNGWVDRIPEMRLDSLVKTEYNTLNLTT